MVFEKKCTRCAKVVRPRPRGPAHGHKPAREDAGAPLDAINFQRSLVRSTFSGEFDMYFLLLLTIIWESSVVALVFPPLHSESIKTKGETKGFKRLPPSAFRQLPLEIAVSLERRACVIPQYWNNRPPHNVIKGEFMRKGQMDWAVLCSRNGSSSILVFWNGSLQSVSEIAKGPDRHYVGTIAAHEPVYYRAIRSASSAYILDHYRAYEGPRPAVITHQGIEDGDMEKGSIIHYRYRGKWLELPGAD